MSPFLFVIFLSVHLGWSYKKIIFVEAFSAMHESLIKYFNRYATIALTENEIASVENAFIPKKFRKKQYLLQEGEVCKYNAFILQGAMRQYTVDDKGEEHILRLLIENWWAADRESLMRQTPSIYFIDAWEESLALLVSKDDLTDMINNIPALSEWARALDVTFAISSSEDLVRHLVYLPKSAIMTLKKPIQNLYSAFLNIP